MKVRHVAPRPPGEVTVPARPMGQTAPSAAGNPQTPEPRFSGAGARGTSRRQDLHHGGLRALNIPSRGEGRVALWVSWDRDLPERAAWAKC
eukprot:15435751-Alexandrium_andersonii.AAC.2